MHSSFDYRITHEGYDAPVSYHINCALKTYFLYLSHICGTNVIYMDVVYINYFLDLERIHEFNWGVFCLAYLYFKLDEASLGGRDKWSDVSLSSNRHTCNLLIL